MKKTYRAEFFDKFGRTLAKHLCEEIKRCFEAIDLYLEPATKMDPASRYRFLEHLPPRRCGVRKGKILGAETACNDGVEAMKRRAGRGYALNETGAVAPLVGIMIFLFIGCLALVVDLGMLHNVKVQLQRAADASALAGALQLNTAVDQDSRADKAARAAAAANRVQGVMGLSEAGGWVDNDSVTVEVGHWDTDPNASNRFTSAAANTGNAVKVTATIEVQHIFARIFRTSSTVRADAIAVAEFKEPGLPIAMLSCIPISEGAGSQVCDVRFYKFKVTPDDTAGWTTLTYRPVNANKLKYFFTEEGNKDLSKILYGTGEDHEGLENEPVLKWNGGFDTSVPCGEKNVDLNIVCGLGPDYVPGVQNPVDPLNYNPLPRWDVTDGSFDRIWSMDGVLRQGHVAGESETAYRTRLDVLKAAAISGDYSAYETTYHVLPTYQKEDGRFQYFIGSYKGKTIAKFDEPLRYAGYPSVAADQGEQNSVLQEFIDLSSTAGHFKRDLTARNPPLNETEATSPHVSYGGGDTLSVTIPVIFAGLCGDWQALGEHAYVGTANLLLTRLWKGVNDCVDARNPVQVFSGNGCGGFTPSLGANDTFACVTGQANGAEAGIEGLTVPRGLEAETGILRVYLVE